MIFWWFCCVFISVDRLWLYVCDPDVRGLCFIALGDVRKNDTSELSKPRVWNHQCVSSFECILRKSCMTDYKKKLKKNGGGHVSSIVSVSRSRPPRGHQSCQLLIFLKATKHTPVNVCECERVCVCVCVLISGGQFRVRLALSELQREQFGQLWLAGEQLKHWRWLQRRH